jgi:hypothetical protein
MMMTTMRTTTTSRIFSTRNMFPPYTATEILKPARSKNEIGIAQLSPLSNHEKVIDVRVDSGKSGLGNHGCSYKAQRCTQGQGADEMTQNREVVPQELQL